MITLEIIISSLTMFILTILLIFLIYCLYCDIFKHGNIKNIITNNKALYLNEKLNKNNSKEWNNKYRLFNKYFEFNADYNIYLTYNEFISYSNLSNIDIFNNISYDSINQYFNIYNITMFNQKDLLLYNRNKYNNYDYNIYDFDLNKDSNVEVKIFKKNSNHGLCLSFKFAYICEKRIYFISIDDYKKYCQWLENLIKNYIYYKQQKNLEYISDIMCTNKSKK